ncbi:MAG TPA: TetR/AcrR family transcriptional regulator [Yinghuangia sp.]|uniref:TetR/AcrR family transcriptional regulator n=1 Tax=Yinghuangia sp. YIM S10712 TaxID=3436930 RepID=UPI002C8CE0C6|nr:TetR/AcrR family transcriptional regulator [Yinghuangia sp.]
MSPQHRPDHSGESPTLAQRAVRRRVAGLEETAQSDVERLMQAGLALMVDSSGRRGPRVADIVAAAGLSNDAFYRYFGSKDALVEAIVEQGSRTVVSYVRHRIAAADGPHEKLEAGVDAIMKQASDADLAGKTRAVLSNSTMVSTGSRYGTAEFVDELAALFVASLTDLGAHDPARTARVIATTAVASMQYYLFRGEVPTEDDLAHLSAFALAGATEQRDASPTA